MSKLRSMLHSTTREDASSSNDRLLVDNFRLMQPLGSRTLYTSDPRHATLFTSPLHSPISVTVAILLGFILMFVLLNRSSIHQVVFYGSDNHTE